MKMHIENEVILGNTGESKSFTISASAKAFQILSSGIYKHKIRAIVREVICNANDAHIFGKTSEKFIITSPTVLNLQFIVRDFGPGLSHEDMTEVYTRYFESTKADCNEQTGAFGLGAKSPFAYTDTFTVASYYEGQCTIYNAMVANGQPSLVKIYSGPFEDGDRSGIEVTVPVKETDVAKWQQEISTMLLPFDKSKYELKNLSTAVGSLADDPNYSTDWYSASSNSHYKNGIFAIYGNIVYPLDGTPGLKAEWLRGKHNALMFHFPLGTLLPQPSREELQMDEFTIKNICDRVNSVNNKMMTDDIKHLKSITNIRELLRKIHSMHSNQYHILERSNVEFNGKTLSQINKTLNLQHIEPYYRGFGCRVYQIGESANRLKTVVTASRYSYTKASQVELISLFGYNVKKAIVIINDLDNQSKLHYSMKGLVHSGLWQERTLVTVVSETVIDDALPEIQAVMAGDEVVVYKTSEMEDIRKLVPGYIKVKVARNSARPSTPNVITHTWDANRNMYISQSRRCSTDEIAELTGYVMGVNSGINMVPSLGFSNVFNIQFSTISSVLSKYTKEPIHQVKKTTFNRIVKNKNVKCAFEKFSQIIEDLVNSIDTFKVEYDEVFVKNILAHEEFTKLKEYLNLGWTPKERMLSSLIDTIAIVSGLPGDHTLVKTIQKYDGKRLEATNLHGERLREFETTNPMANFVLYRIRTLEEPMLSDIKNGIKLP